MCERNKMKLKVVFGFKKIIVYGSERIILNFFLHTWHTNYGAMESTILESNLQESFKWLELRRVAALLNTFEAFKR